MSQAGRTTLRLILGDQLNALHPWLAQPRPDVLYTLMELRQETDYVLHHAQKVLGVFAAMRRFAALLERAGHRVHYLRLDDAANRQNLCANLEALCAQHRVSAFEYQEPDEYRLDQQLAQWCARQPMPCQRVGSAHFYTERYAAAEFFAPRGQWRQEYFYRHLRRLHGVLLTPQGEPEGGRWNYDADNRQPWAGQPPEPPDTRPSHDLSPLWQMLQAQGVATFGAPAFEALRWPLDRNEALAQLDGFIEHTLPHYGAFQDALAHHHWRLFHSLLSFALNLKLLQPVELVQRAVAAWRAGAVPLAAAEGFIRQILGWREYVRGVYWAHMPGYTESNHLGHTRALPHWFWSGDTHMACVASAVRSSLAHGWAHHIQRLMVIGNFALLAGLEPQALHRWYLGIYVDAYEWVEAPNTLGMSQFADGGRMASKPYVSSAAYLQRMGDHCAHCRYAPQQKTGPRACPFNALYWDFFERQAATLARQPRLATVYSSLRRMAPDARHAQRQQAALHLQRLEEL